MGNEKTECVVNTKFKELTENVDFMEKVLESKTEKEVRSLFEKEGVTLSENDIKSLSEAISKIAKKTGVMPEEELSHVAGGMGNGAAGAIGAAAGLVGGGAIAGIAGLIGAGYAFKRGMDYSDSWWNKVSNSLGFGGNGSSTSTTTTVRKTTK